MENRLQASGGRGARAAATAGVLLFALAHGSAQGLNTFGADQGRSLREKTPNPVQEKASMAPAFTIAVEPLGYSAPGAIYLGQRFTMASLDFLDEDRLLLTFRVPGLIHRQASDSWGDEERKIRAVLLSLPRGAVEAETVWSLHDRARYLWMLKDGHFLVRDKENLLEGGPSLELKQLLRFPGPLLSVSLDPTQRYMVTNSHEPVPPKAGEVPTPTSASATITTDGPQSSGQPETVVRILKRDTGQVMLVSRVRAAVQLPMNGDGYIEGLRGSGTRWMLNLHYFTGGSRVLGYVDSECSPTYDFVAQRVVVATTCLANGADRLVALDTDGHRLWEMQSPAASVWPMIVNAPDGSRLARETLNVNHAVNAYEPLDPADIKGQVVKVLDAATGKAALTALVTPALDAGGNVAISPSGKRIAVINGGNIEVFELPAALPLPPPAAPPAAPGAATH